MIGTDAPGATPRLLVISHAFPDYARVLCAIFEHSNTIAVHEDTVEMTLLELNTEKEDLRVRAIREITDNMTKEFCVLVMILPTTPEGKYDKSRSFMCELTLRGPTVLNEEHKLIFDIASMQRYNNPLAKRVIDAVISRLTQKEQHK